MMTKQCEGCENLSMLCAQIGCGGFVPKSSEVNRFLNSGAVISSTNCGFINDAIYNYCGSYQDFLVCEINDQNITSKNKTIKAKIQALYEKANAIPLSSRGAQFASILDDLRELLTVI